MPTTRRSTGSARGRTGPSKGQSTISFHSKVTKSVPQDTKKAVVAPSVAKVEPADVGSPAKEEVEDVVVDEPEVEETEIEQQETIPEKSEAELQAEKVTDAQISKYWKGIEKQRRAPRVHQQDLTQSEMVLRYFDVSSQYGVSVFRLRFQSQLKNANRTTQPCIGTPRMKRWQRAERLGLNPPIEVLAVLLKEEKAGNPGIEKAQMDKIMNSISLMS